jgi:hypothetical protein
MAAVAHGWKKPGGGGPPKSVAKEFNAADTGTRTLAKGMVGSLSKHTSLEGKK